MALLPSFRPMSGRAVRLVAGAFAAMLALTGATAASAQAAPASTACSSWTMLQYMPNIYGMACVSSPNGANTQVYGQLYNGSVRAIAADFFAYVNNETIVRFTCGKNGIQPGEYLSCPTSAAFWTPPPRYARVDFYVDSNFGGTLYSPWLS
jgi:hypothetical protein